MIFYVFAVASLALSLSLSASLTLLQFLLLGASKTRIYDHFCGTRKAPSTPSKIKVFNPHGKKVFNLFLFS
jgi:hypothetical protein